MLPEPDTVPHRPPEFVCTRGVEVAVICPVWIRRPIPDWSVDSGIIAGDGGPVRDGLLGRVEAYPGCNDAAREPVHRSRAVLSTPVECAR